MRNRSTPLAKCVRKSPSNATFAPGITTRHVYRLALPAQPSVRNHPSFSARQRRFSNGGCNNQEEGNTMATTARPDTPPPTANAPRSTKSLWHTPTSKAALFWFLFAFLYCVLFYTLYAVLFKAPILTGPWFDHVFRAGVMSYVAIIAVAA